MDNVSPFEQAFGAETRGSQPPRQCATVSPQWPNSNMV